MTAFMIVRLPSHSKALDAVEFMHSNYLTYRISTNIPLMNFLLSSGGGESRQPGVFEEFEPGKEVIHIVANMTCIFSPAIKVEANSTENSRPNENPVPNQRVIKEEVDTSTVDQPVDRNPRLEIFSVASESVEPREISSAAPLNPSMDVGQGDEGAVDDHQEEEINSSLNQVESGDGVVNNVLLAENQEFDENIAEIPMDIPMPVAEQETQAVYLVEAQQTAEEHEEANFSGENEGVGDVEQTEDVEEGDIADELLEPLDADDSTVTHRPIHNDDLLFDFEDSLNDDLQMEKNVIEPEDDEEKDMEEDEKQEEFQEEEEELVEEQEREIDKMEEDLEEEIDENSDDEELEEADEDSDEEEKISDEKVDANSDEESDEEKATQKKKKKIGRPTGNSIGRHLYACFIKNCSSSYTSFRELEKHMEIHTGKQKFSCDVCKKKFFSKAAAMVHIQRKKKKECCACGKKFSQSGNLVPHYRSHTAEKPFVCKTCGKGFSVLITLKNHMLTHTGEKPFPCGSCKESFALKTRLKEHERTHTGEKPFKCSHCDYKCSKSSSMRAHNRSHAGNKPYSCGRCEKRFYQKSDLTRHEMTHTGEKPFECKDCGRRFVRKSQMTVHMRMHAGQKTFSCKKCDAKFIQSNSLRWHMKKNHQ